MLFQSISLLKPFLLLSNSRLFTIKSRPLRTLHVPGTCLSTTLLLAEDRLLSTGHLGVLVDVLEVLQL